MCINISGCDAYTAELPFSRNSVARKEDLTSTGTCSWSFHFKRLLYYRFKILCKPKHHESLICLYYLR